LRELELDRQLEEEGRNELDRRGRYLDFLEREHGAYCDQQQLELEERLEVKRNIELDTSSIVRMELIVTDIIVSSRRS
jgi:hypothetical protein